MKAVSFLALQVSRGVGGRRFVGQKGCYNVDNIDRCPDKASAPRSDEKSEPSIYRRFAPLSDHIAAGGRLLAVTDESSTGLRGFPLLSVAVLTFCSNFPGSGDATADV